MSVWSVSRDRAGEQLVVDQRQNLPDVHWLKDKVPDSTATKTEPLE